MKSKKCFFSVILVSLILLSCGQMTFDSENIQNSAYLTVCLSDFSERTILPEKGHLNDYAYELYGTDVNGKQHLLQFWNNYKALSASKVDIKTGKWIFELHALKNSEIVLTDVTAFTISSGENRISFNLRELSYGNGNLYIELYFSENIAKKIEAIVLDDDGSFINGFERESLSVEYDLTKLKNKAIFQLNDIPKGYYLIRYFLYENESDSDYSAVYNTFVRIEPCFTSSGIEEIDFSENLYDVSFSIDHIEITKNPDTTLYYEEQTLSYAGLEVCACYEDGRKEIITNYTTSIEEDSKLSQTDNVVSIAYGEFTASFEITVLPDTLEGIYIVVPDREKDNSWLLSKSGNTFSAKSGYSNYEWYIDGKKVNYSGMYLNVGSLTIGSGNHTLMLVVEDDSGKRYSAASEFVVYENIIAFIKVAIENFKEVSDLLFFDNISFTASSGFSSYTWWLDDVIQTADTEFFALPEDICEGNHTVTVIVKDSVNNYFSESKTVSVTKDNLRFDENVDTTIGVSLLDYQDEDLLEYDDTWKRFSVKKGYTGYSWWLDDEKQSETKNYFSITDNVTKGNHTITVIVQDSSGKYYSATRTFYVSVENLQINDDSETSKIYVSLPDYSDNTDLLVYDDLNRKFYASAGFKTYSWWLDDVMQQETGRYYSLLNTIAKGNHTITIVVQDSYGKYYSFTRDFYVSAEDLQLDENTELPMISITVPDYTEKEDLILFESDRQVFYAKNGYSVYSWWVDGTKVSENRTFILSKSDCSTGNHILMLAVTDSSGNKYSESRLFTVSGTYTDKYSEIYAIYVVLPKYQEVEELLSYTDSVFYGKSGFSTYTWWLDDEKTSQTGKRFSIANLSNGNHTLMLVVETSSGAVYSSTAEIVIY